MFIFFCNFKGKQHLLKLFFVLMWSCSLVVSLTPSRYLIETCFFCTMDIWRVWKRSFHFSLWSERNLQASATALGNMALTSNQLCKARSYTLKFKPYECWRDRLYQICFHLYCHNHDISNKYIQRVDIWHGVSVALSQFYI